MEFAEFIKSPTVDGVVLRQTFREPTEGTLCITGHHIIISSRQDHTEELWLLHKNVDTVEKKLAGSSGTLTLRCKDFQVYVFEIPSAEECLNVVSSIEQLSNIHNVNLSYAFFYRPMYDIIEDGWQAFSTESEYTRLVNTVDEWRISHVNRNFQVCASYPEAVVVPKSVDDDTLIRVASFRHLSRFPVLSYYHKDNHAVILRSSQPMTGPMARRCKEDEKLINAVLGIGKRGYIIDTRTANAAKIWTNKGGGVEPEAHYPQWKRLHQSVQPYQVQNEGLIKLMEVCTDAGTTTDKWLSKLDSSGWLGHVKDALNCACVVAQCVDKDNASVLVHGTEGIDTTLQVTSLAQVILDPDCRTIRGFEALIEREWVQAGHPFAQRCARSAFAVSKHRNEAPVFLLFIDAVWQIWKQYPCSFEFNERFLITLIQQAYASKFGTFLCDTPAERRECNLAARTVSLWSYLNRPDVLQKYMNSLYEPNLPVIWPSVAPQSLEIWSALYLSSMCDQRPLVEAQETIDEIKDHNKDLKLKVLRLRRTLAALEKEAIDQGLIPQVVQSQ